MSVYPTPFEFLLGNCYNNNEFRQLTIEAFEYFCHTKIAFLFEEKKIIIGDLEKIISKSEHAGAVFNENTMKLSELSKLSKKEKNQKILSFFEKLGRDGKLDKKSVDSMITKLMKGGSKPNANKILGFARGLNSVPGVITTFLISPYILGWFIPRLTYANTRRMHEKAEKERQQKTQNLNKAV
jgi:hypothetical protein